MKLGILGGTFDPPHVGHLILAEQARTQLSLDKVLFMPAGDPWRKADRSVSPAAQRLVMARLAIEGNDALEVDDREVRREGPTYTVVTLREMRAELSAADELYFLAGEDTLADMITWHEPQGIAELAFVVVALRPGEWPKHDLVPDDRFIALPMPYLDISSTGLRDMAREGKSLRYLVPDAVEAYIRSKSLYGG